MIYFDNAILRVAIVLAAAFVLTSAVMFWLPLISPAEYGSDVIGGYDVYDYGSARKSYDFYPYTDALTKVSAEAERDILDEIASELKQKPRSELFRLKAYEDVCLNGLIDCRSISSAKVKRFIDAILEDRQAYDASFSARSSMIANVISAGSMFISFLALIVAGLTYWRKRREAA